MSAALPVTIFTGYLGAGKTTLINGLLSQQHGRRITVLVNDFGDVAIDEDLIVSRDGDTIALANGCMCCSLGDDLFDALDRILRARVLPDHLVIETSGVADPGRIAQIALAEPMLEHRGTVTVVDIINLVPSLADPVLADTVCRQLAAASLVVASKSDLCDVQQIVAAEAQWRAHAPQGVVSVDGSKGVAAELLLGEFAMTDCQTRQALHHHHETYRSWTRDMAVPVRRAALERFLARDDLGIYRLKGFVRLKEGGIAIAQKAGRHWSVEPLPATSPTPALRIVAIGLRDVLDTDLAEHAIGASVRDAA
jgi:G3E family GTPase